MYWILIVCTVGLALYQEYVPLLKSKVSCDDAIKDSQTIVLLTVMPWNFTFSISFLKIEK